MSKNQAPQEGIFEAIRTEIAKIPPGELDYAKPSRVLPGVAARGIEITASVRSATSKLLSKAKEKPEPRPTSSALASATVVASEAKQANERRELAMQFVEACDGNFELVRAEIARLEQFATMIRRV